MKKTIALLLVLSSFLPLFISSCSLFKDGYIEIWSRPEMFDNVGLDFDQYLENLKNDDSIQIKLCEETENVERYEITYPDQSMLRFDVYPDVETAKSWHQAAAPIHLSVHYQDPFVTSIRIDNIVVIPGLDLLSNNRLISFAKSIGIESDQIVLSKVNESFRIRRKDTDKSFESILEIMEEKGFTSQYSIVLEEGNYQVHCFVSSDNFATYELLMHRGDRAREALYHSMDELILDSPYYEHSHVYYSIGDDLCMYFVGSSVDTLDLWNEIRK